MKVIMEFRPGVGGEEAEKFVTELLGAYVRYAQKQGMHPEVIPGDMRMQILEISGGNARALLEEAGVHRVQRLSHGRMHTSTVTLSCRMESKKRDVSGLGDVRVETYRASGNGGQHRNTTDSAVRLTHRETGITVTSSAHRSQYKNKDDAYASLRARLQEAEESAQGKDINVLRSSQVGGAMRSEARRTYNFTRKEVVDERSGKRIPLKSFFKGNF